MNKTMLVLALLACAVLFAVPAFAADTTPVVATPQVAATPAIDQPVQLTADEMMTTKGEGWKVVLWLGGSIYNTYYEVGWHVIKDWCRGGWPGVKNVRVSGSVWDWKRGRIFIYGNRR